MKIPKRLDFARSCFYELPADTPDLTRYEVYYRAIYPGVFLSRSGPRFYFQFGSSIARDVFLAELEESGKTSGLIIEQQTIYR